MRVRLCVATLLPAAILIASGAALAAPKVQVEPMEIDLGIIKEGGEFERFLELTNIGDGVLVLEDVKTSCGCTAAAVDGVVELKAGESQNIKVTFNSKNMDGDIHKRITVATNDPEQRNTQVVLKANVHRALRWTPKYITLDGVRAKGGFETSLQLQADTELDVQVLEAQILGGRKQDAPSKLFTLETGERRVEGGRHVWDFDVQLVEGTKPQKIAEFLVLKTNQPDDRETLRVPIRGTIAGRLRVYPQYAVLPVTNPGEEVVKSVSVTADEGDFEVVRAVVENSPVEVEIIPKDSGKQTVIKLTYIGEEAGANGVRTLRVETNDPEQPVLELPVRYTTRATPKPQASQG